MRRAASHEVVQPRWRHRFRTMRKEALRLRDAAAGAAADVLDLWRKICAADAADDARVCMLQRFASGSAAR